MINYDMIITTKTTCKLEKQQSIVHLRWYFCALICILNLFFMTKSYRDKITEMTTTKKYYFGARIE